MVKKYDINTETLEDIVKAYYKETAHLILDEVVFGLKYDDGEPFLEAFGKGKDDFGRAIAPFQMAIPTKDIEVAISHYVDPNWMVHSVLIGRVSNESKEKLESLTVSVITNTKQKVK